MSRIIVALSVGVVPVTVPAPASAGDLSSDQLTALAERYANGVPTAQDELYVSARPELGNLLLDSRKTAFGATTQRLSQTETDALTAGESGSSAAGSWVCYRVDRYIVAKSVTGLRMYNYHTLPYWCSTGTLLATKGRSAYFNGITSNVEVITSYRINQWIAVTNGAGAYTGGQAKVCYQPVLDYCVNVYPAQKIGYYTARGSYTDRLWYTTR